MKNSNHTPGPWRVERAYTGTNRFPISHDIDSTARGILAEANGQGGTEQENLANARLIAAAPLLLEAVQSAAIALNNPDSDNWRLTALADIRHALSAIQPD